MRKTDFFTYLLNIALILGFASCVPSSAPSSKKLSGKDGSNSNGDTTGSGPGEKTFLQEGSQQTTTNLALGSNFNDSFYMRGNAVNNYVGAIPSSNSLCFVAYYPSSLTKKLLIIAATKSSFNNYSTGQIEYYLKMYPQDNTLNQNECFTTSLTNALNSKYSTTSFAFKLEDVCPTCTTLISQPVEIYNNGGSLVSQITTGSLKLQISPQSTGTSGSSTGGSGGNANLCSSDATCESLNFDCCLGGQCVKDGEVKSGVDITSNAFLSAQNEVISNPVSYQNYPEFYYICSTNVPPDGDGTVDADAELEKLKRFEKLSELSACLNQISSTDETAYCTIEYENPSATVIAGGGSGSFFADTDDLNFSTLNPATATSCGSCPDGAKNNITEINFGGEVIYKECTTPLTIANGELNPLLSNDDKDSAQPVIIKKTVANTDEDYLKLTYRIDGSCKLLNGTFAQCTKYYVQGQNSCPAKPSDHNDGDYNFKVPSYANLSFNLIVKVGDEIIPESASTWLRDAPNQQIIFNSPVYKNQVVEITFFVNDTSNPTIVNEVMKSKLAAQVEVNTICGCASDAECNLTEVTELQNGNEAIIDYICTYPQPNLPEQPLQETIYVSSRSVPIRFYDLNGVAYDTINSNTPLQEGSVFYYKEGNTLKPNNINSSAPSYIGPNEVYGNMNVLVDANVSAPTDADDTYVPDSAPKPPVKLDVKKGRLYNIYVDQGSFSSCSQCGTDYYSNLKRLFPETFIEKGGGHVPDAVTSNPADTLSKYRRDDLLFGRACFVPMTMLPWSHEVYNDPQIQRVARQNAQHIYYANGYNRDWFGFDYGSLIASYDGVNWFSVGNRRKTTAKSNKLFFAVNAIMGDLTVAGSFKVVISEVTDFASNPSDVEVDVNSAGAQCQKYHYCSTDSDCITQLGYDYACLNVSNLKSYWPKFDSSGAEIPNQGVLIKLTSLLDGAANGQNKRCVYRGRGTPCQTDIYGPVDDQSTSYANTTDVAAHACAPNYYCESIGTSSKFNTTISRFGKGPENQNGEHCLSNDASNDDCTDTVGVSARLPGRPYNYQGNQSIPATTVTHLQGTNLGITGMCIPGKDASAGSTSFTSLNSTASSTTDATFGVAPSPDFSVSKADYLYSACPTIDEDENYIIFDGTHEEAGRTPASEEIRKYSASQNILSNALKHPEFSTLELFKDIGTLFEEVGYRSNTCLRAAGASCFSDYECAPNNLISSEVNQIFTASAMNEAELEFWKEELVCSNKVDKRLPFNITANPLYDVKENRCCRELGKEITIYSAETASPLFDAKNIPGIGIDLNDNDRYSRLNTVADIIGTKDPGTTPLQKFLITPSVDSATASTSLSLLEQYKTFDTAASRTCCTENWVRNFHEDNGGGGHTWAAGKLQGFNKEGLRCLSWNPNTTSNFSGSGTDPYTCSAAFWNTSECEIRNISGADENKYLNWLAKLELLGIPQIMLETPTHTNGVACIVDGDGTDDQTAAAAGTPIPNTIVSGAAPEYNDGSGNLLSAADSSNFYLTDDSELKMVFDDKKVTCCMPAGEDVASNITSEQCCTGVKSGNKCCLNDFTDITLYLNRYVSSEANGLNDSLFDKSTGYFKNKEDTLAVAKIKNICCSCKAAFGVAISELFVPGAEVNPDARTRRFLYSDSNVDNNDETGNKSDIFNAKIKWNNHLYCVPQDYPDAIDICGGNNSGSGGSI